MVSLTPTRTSVSPNRITRARSGLVVARPVGQEVHRDPSWCDRAGRCRGPAGRDNIRGPSCRGTGDSRFASATLSSARLIAAGPRLSARSLAFRGRAIRLPTPASIIRSAARGLSSRWSIRSLHRAAMRPPGNPERPQPPRELGAQRIGPPRPQARDNVRGFRPHQRRSASHAPSRCRHHCEAGARKTHKDTDNFLVTVE
jgi:hypothetical protein